VTTSTDPQALLADAVHKLRDAADLDALKALERDLLGKSGPAGRILGSIPTLPPEERKAAGARANELKRALEEALAARRRELEEKALAAERTGGDFDPTLPPAPLERGG
jgi:phenylalanyl-tRNA synthetase alpha chain